MLNDKQEIKEWLDSMDIENYTINDNFTVDVDGNVNLSAKKLTNIPVQFGIVKGYFYCNDNQLTSLQGCPHSINNNFFCSANQLISLEGGPTSVNGDFYCNDNQLTTLQGCPKFVSGIFYCKNNSIKNLSDFDCEFSDIFYHKGSIIEIFSEFYIEGELKLTYKDIENIKLNNKLNNTLKNKTETINSINRKKL